MATVVFRLRPAALKATSLFFIGIFLLTGSLNGQIKEIGLPFINNYKRSVYQAGTQNWSIAQDKDGNMYFGNNDGLLIFDGNNWKLHMLPNNSIVRSVTAINKRIYVGGFEEFGYFITNDIGETQYFSLSEKLPEEKSKFDEIWRIYLTRNGIIFQSFFNIFIYNETTDEITIIDAPTEFGFSYIVNNILYVVDKSSGLYILKGTELEQVFSNPEFFRANEIPFIIPNGVNSLLIGTTNDGIYSFDGMNLSRWKPQISSILIEHQIYTGLMLPGNQIAIGTIQNGLYVVDFDGRIVLHIDRLKGIQNNTILSLFLDRHSNLWLGLDNGIDALEISSPISILNYNYNIGATYTSILYDGMLYVGTNQGLFARRFDEINHRNPEDEAFKLVEGTKGQVWSLEIIDNVLICGHNLGAFRINKYNSTRISDITGGWDYAEVPWDHNLVVGGTYGGLVLYEKKIGSRNFLQQVGMIQGFNESCKEIYFDRNNYLWITHGYKGIFRISLNEDCSMIEEAKLYSATNGLPVLAYSMTEINGEFYLVAYDGLYSYDPEKDLFYKEALVNAIFDPLRGISKIIEDYRGDLWYVSDEIGVLRLQEDGSYTKISKPFNRIRRHYINRAFVNIYINDASNVFIGSEEGILHYDSEKTKDFRIPYNTFIGEVTAKSKTRDSLLFHGITGQFSEDNPVFDIHTQLSHRYNSISFQFMTPFFEAPQQINYSYRLKGYSDSWTDWNNHTFADYTNLREGNYTFEVMAKNVYDHISEPAGFSFIIKPPFYRSKLAYILYAIFLMIISVLIVLISKRKVDKARELEKQKHKKALVAKEQEFLEESRVSKEKISQLKNEKLLIEMRHKDMELANSTMLIIQKNKFMTKVKNEIHDIIGKLQIESNKQELRQLVKRIDKDIRSEQQWKVFDKYFDEVHQDFTKRLKEKHPELTPNDLRLCAYLRMNISSKEIAPLMNISIRGVEISRYRLRKKLDLDRDTNLTEYIMDI